MENEGKINWKGLWPWPVAGVIVVLTNWGSHVIAPAILGTDLVWIVIFAILAGTFLGAVLLAQKLRSPPKDVPE